MELKAGVVVSIYEDPITCKKLEGRARLVKLLRADHGDGLSRWVVWFPDDGEFARTVNQKRAQPRPSFGSIL